MSDKLKFLNEKCKNDDIKCKNDDIKCGTRGLKKYNGYCYKCYQRLSNIEYLTSHLQCKETKQKVIDDLNCFYGIIILNKK